MGEPSEQEPEPEQDIASCTEHCHIFILEASQVIWTQKCCCGEKTYAEALQQYA